MSHLYCHLLPAPPGGSRCMWTLDLQFCKRRTTLLSLSSKHVNPRYACCLNVFGPQRCCGGNSTVLQQTLFVFIMFCTDCWCELSSVWNRWSKAHFRIHFGGACASSAPQLFLAQTFTVFFPVQFHCASVWCIKQCCILEENHSTSITVNCEKDLLFTYSSCLCSMWGPFVLMCQHVSLWAVSMYLHKCNQDKFLHYSS